MNKKTKKGFTIVELVIVIAVIAILAAVLIPTFSSIINKANESADIQAVRQMNMALAAESAIKEPEGFADVIAILSAAGYNAEDKLIPVSTGHSFYWHSDHNVILLANNDPAAVVFPTDNTDLVDNFTTDLAADKLYDLRNDPNLIGFSQVEIDLYNGESVTLDADATLSNVFTFPAGSKATLDLNGEELTTAEVSQMVIQGELTIKNGYIKAGAAMEGGGADEMGIVVGVGGKLILEDVTVTAINPNTYNYSISCQEGGTAEINNCTFEMADGVTEATAIYNGGEMNITNSRFNYANYTNSSSAVIKNFGTMELDGVTVTSGSNCLSLRASASTTLKGGTYEYNGYLYYNTSWSWPTVEIEGASIKGTIVTTTDTDGTYGY